MIDLAIDSRVFINNEVDAALQELDLIFNTENTELIGYPNYGSNFEQFLWQMTPSPDSLQQYIKELFHNTYFLNKMSTDVKVQVLDGEYRNIYYVNITVEDPNTGQYGYRDYQLR